MKKLTPTAILLCTIAFMVFNNVSSQENAWHAPIHNDQLVRPVSGFGLRTHPLYKTKKLHKGVDYLAPTGTPVHAVNMGVVSKITHNSEGYGIHMEITHNDSIITRYAHLNSIEVKLNQQVTMDEVIATVGSTGTSTQPHLHFEIIKNGEHIDPITYIKYQIEEIED